jgi:hypothetical protein
MQCTSSGAAGSSLCTTIKYLRGATGIGLGTTIKYLRRTTSAAADIGLGTTAKYLVNQNTGAGNNWAKAHIQHRNSRTAFSVFPLLLEVVVADLKSKR